MTRPRSVSIEVNRAVLPPGSWVIEVLVSNAARQLLDEIADDRHRSVDADLRHLLIACGTSHRRLDRGLLLGVNDDAAIDIDIARAVAGHRDFERDRRGGAD